MKGESSRFIACFELIKLKYLTEKDLMTNIVFL